MSDYYKHRETLNSIINNAGVLTDIEEYYQDSLTSTYKLDFVIKNIPPVLTNDMYFSVPKKVNKVRKDGTPYQKWMATTAATPALKKYQLTMEELLSTIIDEQSQLHFYELFHKRTNKDYGVILRIDHYVPENKIFDFDLSNTIKAFEDCLVRRLKVDDKYTITLITTKSINMCPANNWIIHTEYSIRSIRRVYEE
jgi:hypothetical protein